MPCSRLKRRRSGDVENTRSTTSCGLASVFTTVLHVLTCNAFRKNVVQEDGDSAYKKREKRTQRRTELEKVQEREALRGDNALKRSSVFYSRNAGDVDDNDVANQSTHECCNRQYCWCNRERYPKAELDENDEEFLEYLYASEKNRQHLEFCRKRPTKKDSSANKTRFFKVPNWMRWPGRKKDSGGVCYAPPRVKVIDGFGYTMNLERNEDIQSEHVILSGGYIHLAKYDLHEIAYTPSVMSGLVTVVDDHPSPDDGQIPGPSTSRPPGVFYENLWILKKMLQGSSSDDKFRGGSVEKITSGASDSKSNTEKNSEDKKSVGKISCGASDSKSSTEKIFVENNDKKSVGNVPADSRVKHTVGRQSESIPNRIKKSLSNNHVVRDFTRKEIKRSASESNLNRGTAKNRNSPHSTKLNLEKQTAKVNKNTTSTASHFKEEFEQASTTESTDTSSSRDVYLDIREEDIHPCTEPRVIPLMKKRSQRHTEVKNIQKLNKNDADLMKKEQLKGREHVVNAVEYANEYNHYSRESRLYPFMGDVHYKTNERSLLTIAQGPDMIAVNSTPSVYRENDYFRYQTIRWKSNRLAQVDKYVRPPEPLVRNIFLQLWQRYPSEAIYRRQTYHRRYENQVGTFCVYDNDEEKYTYWAEPPCPSRVIATLRSRVPKVEHDCRVIIHKPYGGDLLFPITESTEEECDDSITGAKVANYIRNLRECPKLRTVRRFEQLTASLSVVKTVEQVELDEVSEAEDTDEDKAAFPLLGLFDAVEHRSQLAEEYKSKMYFLKEFEDIHEAVSLSSRLCSVVLSECPIGGR